MFGVASPSQFMLYLEFVVKFKFVLFGVFLMNSIQVLVVVQ